MKKILLSTISAIMLMPMATSAQDDMYFVPTKENVKKASKEYGMPKDTYYCGSNRNVDEYNRRLRSTVEPINNDTTANDVINFDSIKGEYPDSLALMEQQEDYKYTRNMSRWDDYAVSNAYWNGYTDGRFNRWYGWSSFYDPWYYSPWYYDPWYYDPWYYGYAGWHGGWYAGWYGWHPYHTWGWGWYDYHYPIYVGTGGGGRHWSSPVERFKDNRFSRTSSTRINGSGISRGIANRDRTNSLGTRSINRNTASRRFGNSQGDIRNVSSNRNTSYNNNSSSFNSSRSSSFSSGGGSSFSSGGSRSFGGGGGGIKSSGAGRRR